MYKSMDSEVGHYTLFVNEEKQRGTGCMAVLEINPIRIKLGTNMNNFRSLQMFLMALRSEESHDREPGWVGKNEITTMYPVQKVNSAITMPCYKFV